MIYEIILLDRSSMDVLYAYSIEGEIEISKMLTHTGLATLIETAIKQLSDSDFSNSGKVFSLKTGENTFSFTSLGDYVLVVRGSSDEENEQIIKKISKEVITGVAKLKDIKEALRKVFKMKDDKEIKDFSDLWG
ncbi:MAG: hypothetical protein DRO67_06995 [Candidatus Asgardarchaeum californiense]|nr:MAG: hypothetical protein DRO67_06995 [Candidatus Asgardarchaeum californiense]